MANRIQRAFNALVGRNSSDTGQKPQTNLNSYISPIALSRIRQDISTFRDAIREAEQAWYPQRFKLQQLLNDTALNGHVRACMERRKDLTLLRDFKITNGSDKVYEDLYLLHNTYWFRMFVDYSLDAMFYGYNLIALGDLVNNGFPNISIVKRENVSPDRLHVGKFQYSIDGVNFMKPPYRNFHVYVGTPSMNAQSKCGLGLLTYCAPYEIYLRQLSGWNATALEMFGMPYRVGKTNKTNEDERAELANVLMEMGASGWAIVDPMDEIEFLEAGGNGSGMAGYQEFEKRNESKISKLVLGHANAMDEQAGKLGASQGDDNPVYKALRDKQIKDGLMIEDVVNKELYPRLRALGFMIPEDAVFEFTNDAEQEEFRQRVDQSNKVTAEIAQVMKNAGLQMDAAYFQERTGIPTTQMQLSAPNPNLTESIQNKLSKIYNHKCNNC